MLLSSLTDGSAGIVRDDRFYPVAAILRDLGRSEADGLSEMRYLIAHWDRAEARLAGFDGGASRALSDCVLGPPVPDPTKIVAAPINYVDHQVEMSQTSTVEDLGIFLKAPSSLIGHGGVVQLPYHDRRFDQEGELGVIIGRTARTVPLDRALDHVFGYSCIMDMTMRGGEDRSTRKSFETFTPMGPWIVTSDAAPDPTDVDLECEVSGKVRQKVNTRDLIQGVADLVAYASSVMTLHPGDVIATGTPAGVGPVVAGDYVELRLSGIGTLRVTVASENPVASPTRGDGKMPVPPPPQ